MQTPARLRRTAATCLAAGVVLAGCSSAEDIAGNGPTSPRTSVAPSSSAPAPRTETTPSPSVGGSGNLPDGFGSGQAGSGLQRFYSQQVDWQDCGQNQCAEVWVPLDYDHPNGRAITLALKRSPATNAAQRSGSLFINPGGPGGSGVDYLDYVDLDGRVTNVYDVVGFDPRGVARSTPVDCLSDTDLDAYVASDPTPDDPAEVRQFQGVWSHYTTGCQRRSGPLLAHVSTVEVARDLDVLRELVGDKKLNYFGASYGTYIGATYAALFPRHVDRMVLDGAVDPLANPHTTEIGQAAGFDRALTAYLGYCVDSGDCPLGDSVGGARQALIQFFKRLDASPLPTTSGRELTEGLAFLGVIVPLYSRDSWDYETSALRAALSGNGDTLLLLADYYTDRKPDGSYQDNSMEVQSAVNCLDHPEHESLAQIEAGASEFVKHSPVFGQAATWWPYACSNWPVLSTQPRPDYSAKGAPPIVVVGTTRDPATPYQQAVDLANELDSGVLLSRDGDGHTAYGSGNACIDNAVDTYLVSGKPPADKTMC
ncbi:MAG: alpha/beta fold hydrolase [Propionibacteriales bacterium]|nr:alpha/beta fold hydrolase [Propionibacteriales bacterium]